MLGHAGIMAMLVLVLVLVLVRRTSHGFRKSGLIQNVRRHQSPRTAEFALSPPAEP